MNGRVNRAEMASFVQGLEWRQKCSKMHPPLNPPLPALKYVAHLLLLVQFAAAVVPGDLSANNDQRCEDEDAAEREKCFNCSLLPPPPYLLFSLLPQPLSTQIHLRGVHAIRLERDDGGDDEEPSLPLPPPVLQGAPDRFIPLPLPLCYCFTR